ncbi:MAG: hypothetical protein ABH827_04565 [bacterium]
MKKTIRIFFAWVIFCSLLTTVKPISEDAANMWAIASGVGVGLTGAVTGSQVDTPAGRLLMFAVSCVAGGFTWWVLSEYLHTLTPAGRIECVEKVVREVSCDEFVARKFETDFDVISYVNFRFFSNWPLVDAKNMLVNFSGSLKLMRNNLIEAKREIVDNPIKYKNYSQSCDVLFQKIPALIEIIEQRMASILMCKDFSVQLRLYECHLEAERQRAHERDLLKRAQTGV